MATARPDPDLDPDEVWYSVDQTAARLRISRGTVLGLIHAGRLGAYKIGGQYKVTAGDLTDFLASARLAPLGNRT